MSIADKALYAHQGYFPNVKVHRSAVVNLRAISDVKRCANKTADVYLKRRRAVLKAS